MLGWIWQQNIFTEIFSNYHIPDANGRDSWPSQDGECSICIFSNESKKTATNFNKKHIIFAAAPHPEENQVDNNFSNSRVDNSKFHIHIQ